ncbi:MAG: hypothetical protein RLZZ127_48 [Planctomycetota bacterium]|jgi:hypothetical protein
MSRKHRQIIRTRNAMRRDPLREWEKMIRDEMKKIAKTTGCPLDMVRQELMKDHLEVRDR